MASTDRVRERLEQLRGGGGGGGPRRGGGFDAARVAGPERVAAISGLLLAILMFFGWFVTGSAWQTLARADIALLLLALAPVAVALAYALDRLPAPPESVSLLLAVGGAVAVGIMLVLVVESSGGTVPLVLALLAAGGILYGGVAGLRAPSPGGGGRPPRRSRAGSEREPAGFYDREPPAA